MKREECRQGGEQQEGEHRRGIDEGTPDPPGTPLLVERAPAPLYILEALSESPLQRAVAQRHEARVWAQSRLTTARPVWLGFHVVAATWWGHRRRGQVRFARRFRVLESGREREKEIYFTLYIKEKFYENKNDYYYYYYYFNCVSRPRIIQLDGFEIRFISL